MLDVVIGVHVFAEPPFTGLHFIVLGFFFGGEVSAVSDDVLKPCENLMPVQLHVGTFGFLQFDTLTGAVDPALSRYRMRASTRTVLVL